MCMFHKKNDKTPTAITSEATEKTVMSQKEGKGFILERQIHGQFSDNVNAHTSSFITFVVSLLALFGAFGYVYANTANIFRIGFGFWPELTPSAEALLNQSFTMNSFLLLSVVVSVMLGFIACLCIYLGYAERRDQAQQYKIRHAYGVETVYSTPEENNNWCYFLSSFYRMFYNLLMLLQILVIIVCVLRIAPFLSLPCINPTAGLLIAFSLLAQVVCIVVCLFTKRKYFLWYQKKINECESKSK